MRCWALRFGCLAAVGLWPGLAPGLESAPWPAAQPVAHWVGIAQGGDLSSFVAPWRQESYELQTGEVVDWYRWYKTSWVDLKLTWFSPVTPQWGVLWGVSTGERGPKYRIAPSLLLGAVWVEPISSRERWVFRWSQRLGGGLTEHACQADYGPIGGGVQEVNCRLAASELPPADTLVYLYRRKPSEAQATVSLRWERIF